MTSCCTCPGSSKGGEPGLPISFLVPRDGGRGAQSGSRLAPKAMGSASAQSGFQLLDQDYIKKHFKLPQRYLFLDPFRRPLITFPMTQEDVTNFNLARKYKINQQILDGYLDPNEAISAPSVFPYAKTDAEKQKESQEDEEIIYILQLPDLEYQCPVHKETITTPRFIWHSCKKEKGAKKGEMKRGGGPLNKPKPWLLSRHTDFDLLSQWSLPKSDLNNSSVSAPMLVQMNPDGKWQNCKLGNSDEDRLKTIVQHLINSNALSAAQSYCSQCAKENKKTDQDSNFIQVVLLPICSVDQCPLTEEYDVPITKKDKTSSNNKNIDINDDEKDKVQKKARKRGFVLQRLTDFDLLSQW